MATPRSHSKSGRCNDFARRCDANRPGRLIGRQCTSHAYLYVRGYKHIPHIGDGFLTQASASFAIAVLILAGGPAWLRWAAAAVAGGSLAAFVLSRTVGLEGFIERGWDPSPQAAISVGAEVLTVLLCAGDLMLKREPVRHQPVYQR